jgi:dipeptidyl-peptidase-4
VSSGRESLVADPAVLLQERHEELSIAERARRERARESAAGIVAYSLDDEARYAAFALSSRLWVADLSSGDVRELPAVGPVLDPRLDPSGRWVAYVGAGALRLTAVDAAAVDGDPECVLAEPDPTEGVEADDITWGLAEFVAAEEMARFRGYWWAPDGSAVLAARVDQSAVQRWHITDPANPGAVPIEIPYPASGTPNADVRLHVVAVEGGRVPVHWDDRRFPYLITANWSEHGDPLVLVMSRDQKSAQILAVDIVSGSTSVLHEDHDDAWLDVVPGVPAWLPDGRLVRTTELDGARRLVIDDSVVTPANVQLSAVVAVDEQGVLFGGTDDPTESHLWRVSPDGALSRITRAGTFAAGTASAGTLVLVTRSLEEPGATATVTRADAPDIPIESYAERPNLRANPMLLEVGVLGLRVGVLLPQNHIPGQALPVLMDPYGGPHHQEVVKVHNMWLESQWLANQGFAVVVADGRGTGSRGPEWDRAMYQDVAGVALADQVEALLATAERVPELDLSRVAIRGWSFGGFLAAMAVLRRPDVFAAAVAGAPVTDWRLYDTFYTERYLGHPDDEPAIYDAHSLLGDAPALDRPLLLIHGLADDNVVAAHTLRLSSALVAAGRPHDVLPLSGVTHMTPQEVIAENLLLLQVEWLHRALGAAR